MSSDQDVKQFRERYFSLIEEQKQEKKKEIRLKQIREPKEGETINDTDTPRPESIEKLKQRERKEQFTQLYQAVIEKREKQEQIKDLQGLTDNRDQRKIEEEKRVKEEQQKARDFYEDIEKETEEERLKAIAEDETLRAILGLDKGADAETIRAAIEEFFKKDNRKTIEAKFEGTDHSDRINKFFTRYDNLLKNKLEPSIKNLVDILTPPSEPTTIHIGSISP